MTFNHKVIFRTISIVILFEGIAMLFPMVCAVYYQERTTASAFFLTAISCIAFGLTARRYFGYSTLKIKTREGYYVAFLCWIIVCIIGALPYFLSENDYSFAESLFESAAGWSTTAARVLDINTTPNSLLLWKSICSWLGGMGILILTLSIFPILGVHGQKMAAAEVPGPELEKMTAKMGETAKISYGIYIALTFLELCLLLPSGLNPFDALLNTLTTISTSGVVNLNNDISMHFTPYVKCVFAIFSLIGSLNFMIYFFIYAGKWRKALNSIELRTYLTILLVCSVSIAFILYGSGTYDSLSESLIDATTQSVSFGSTSGFTVADITKWPPACHALLIMLIFIGACGNSTGGSLKVIRVIIWFKLIMRGIYKRIHPKAVKPIMLQGKPVTSASASSITVFIMLYFMFYLASCLILALENQDLLSTLTGTLALFSNNGTGLGIFVDGNYSVLSYGGKIFSSVLMLAGRLEIYAIIVLMSRSFWNSDRI
ncbi:trk system potassium uptake protein TrkH [Clostridiales Family XIII bacterium PM5-7]